MTKQELAKKVAAMTGVDQATALVCVEGVMAAIKDSLIQEEPVYLRGFGSFILKRRAEKTARNISKNTTITIPAHNIPAFKPCKDFLTQVKN
ncbi:MAG: integration host factor subunit beta [Bacteroidaceae bacterium]|nr:integration host factor subunit beta [Bacteroidaceae bacterium]